MRQLTRHEIMTLHEVRRDMEELLRNGGMTAGSIARTLLQEPRWMRQNSESMYILVCQVVGIFNTDFQRDGASGEIRLVECGCRKGHGGCSDGPPHPGTEPRRRLWFATGSTAAAHTAEAMEAKDSLSFP